MPRILLIEDDQVLRRALRIALEKIGFEAGEADNGRDALAIFKEGSFDLVITDLIMPEMEGIETIRALRLLKPKLPIIAITGGGRGSPDNYLQLAKRFGATRTFAKPFELTVLTAAVSEMLGGGASTAGSKNSS